MERLHEREKLWAWERKLGEKGPVLVIRPNLPGERKNLEAGFVSLLFLYELKDVGPFHLHYGEEGLLFLLEVKGEARALKERTLRLEEDHPLGRLVDLDVYENGQELRRIHFSHPPRSCFLCNKPAFLCAREGNHSLEARRTYFLQKVRNYEKTDGEKILWAIHRELSRKYSFGAVSYLSQGGHEDMEARDFISSILAIVSAVETMNFQNLTLMELKKRGLELEKVMFQATGGKNTHKGFIFFLTFILAYWADSLSEEETIRRFSSYYPKLYQELLTEQSFGACAYRKEGIKGARHQLKDGMAYLFQLAKKFRENEDEQWLSLTLLATIDDTTLFKRSDLSTLRRIQFLAREALENRLPIERLEAQFIPPLTSGGVADLFSIILLLSMT